jgi:lipid II:glycine glycyltransferase (peptidoglycan interpeptide bridge formation enzyme)
MIVEELHQPHDWDEWLAEHPFGDILQTWEWGEIKKGELWQALRIRVQQGGQVFGQAQILTRKLPLNMTLYYMPRGPVLDYADPRAAEVLRLMLDWTKDHAVQHRGLMIKIGPAVNDDQDSIKLWLEQLGLRQSFRSVQMRHTRMVDLRPSEADIMATFDKDTRNLVRRAAKEGVVVDKFNDVHETKGLRAFHNMYAITAERGKFPPRPWSQFVRLWELMAPQGMATAYVASFEEQPLAGAVVLRLGKRAYWLWGGSRREMEKKYANYALQWTIMADMKSSGVEEYDMWGIPPTDDPNHPWAGPALFKKGFGGRRVDYIGDYDLPLSPTYPVFTTAEKVRQKVFGQ